MVAKLPAGQLILRTDRQGLPILNYPYSDPEDVRIINLLRLYSESDADKRNGDACWDKRLRTFVLHEFDCLYSSNEFELKIGKDALANGDLKVSPVVTNTANGQAFYLGEEMAAGVCYSFGMIPLPKHHVATNGSLGFNLEKIGYKTNLKSSALAIESFNCTNDKPRFFSCY